MTIPVDALAGVTSVLVVAFVWLLRQHAKLSERVAKLEGRLNGYPSQPSHDR